MNTTRIAQLELLTKDPQEWDLIVVGGGITGAGIFREAAHLGLKVLLVEQKDFAWGTSSRSSKMVHGGLRYLGSGQFGLANDSVKERQNLMAELPGLVDPLPFMMGHYKGVFPGPWIFNKLLAIYDFMAGKRYRKFFSKGIRDYLIPGMSTAHLKGATQFADAVTDDARLVMRVIQAGQEDKGVAINYLKAVEVLKDTHKDQQGVKGLVLNDVDTGSTIKVRAKAVVNATGAWTDELRMMMGAEQVIRPLRGSHLVVPFWRLPVAFSVSFFHPKDKRPVFVFPWEGVTVIGTTDLDHQADSANEASISGTEVAYLLEAVNQQFPESKLNKQDIRSTWSGVRPVVSKQSFRQKGTQSLETGQSVDLEKPSKPSDEKREHAVWDDSGLISVAGGKLTTYRLIAMDVLKKAAPYINLSNEMLKQSSRFESSEKEASSKTDATQQRGAHYLSRATQQRLRGRYGEHISSIYALINRTPDLAEKIGTSDTIWAELVWACQFESVLHLDDLLLRRTRIALLLEHGAEAFMSKIKLICQEYLGWNASQWQSEYDRFQRIMREHYTVPEC